MQKNHTTATIYHQAMFRQIHHKTVPSTHRWALAHVDSLPLDPVVITTDVQTEGIGRRGTPWIAGNSENILATFVFSLLTKDAGNIAQLLAFSTIEVLDTLGLSPAFKWPNDIILSGKKVAGVMADVVDNRVILSIGLNGNMPKEMLRQIDIPATSLQEELGHPIALDTLQTALFSKFFADLLLFQESGFAPFFPLFAKRLAFIGSYAKVGPLEGKIEGLNHDGRLILSDKTGTHLLSTGTLELLP